MIFNETLEDLLELFEKNKVKYVIVGEYSAAFHGYPEPIKDVFFFYETSDENINRLRISLLQLGIGDSSLINEVFFHSFGSSLSIGIGPFAITFIIPGKNFDFDAIYAKRKTGLYGKAKVVYISKMHYVNLKSDGIDTGENTER